MATNKTNDQNFKADVLESKEPVLVDFWAEWCGPCKAIAPSLEELSEEMSNKLKVVKINVEGFSSTLILTIFNLLLISSDNSSREGAIALQGPHHSAQKSTNTGSLDSKTSALKF